MHGLARALQDLQRYDDAIAVAQRLAEIDPDDVLAHTSLSVLYQKKGHDSGGGSGRRESASAGVETAVEEELVGS